jgi:hypothetical protein
MLKAFSYKFINNNPNRKIDKMENQITKAFTGLDAEMFDRQLEWAKARKVAIVEMWAKKKHSSQMNYEILFEIAGGKTWYNLLAYTNKIEEVVRKNIDNLIANRNNRIIKALNKKGITEIQDFELKSSGDGYEGTFVIDGNIVSINTILAGGYNIQCLHQRTLIKVK